MTDATRNESLKDAEVKEDVRASEADAKTYEVELHYHETGVVECANLYRSRNPDRPDGFIWTIHGILSKFVVPGVSPEEAVIAINGAPRTFRVVLVGQDKPSSPIMATFDGKLVILKPLDVAPHGGWQVLDAETKTWLYELVTPFGADPLPVLRKEEQRITLARLGSVVEAASMGQADDPRDRAVLAVQEMAFDESKEAELMLEAWEDSLVRPELTEEDEADSQTLWIPWLDGRGRKLGPRFQVKVGEEVSELSLESNQRWFNCTVMVDESASDNKGYEVGQEVALSEDTLFAAGWDEPATDDDEAELSFDALVEMGTDELARALLEAYQEQDDLKASVADWEAVYAGQIEEIKTADELQQRMQKMIDRKDEAIDILQGDLKTASEEAEMFEARLGELEPKVDELKAKLGLVEGQLDNERMCYRGCCMNREVVMEERDRLKEVIGQRNITLDKLNQLVDRMVNQAANPDLYAGSLMDIINGFVRQYNDRMGRS